LTIPLILVVVIASAQDRAAFRIVTLSYGVNIDGDAISVGQYVKESSKYIYIPEGGYLGVITTDGNAGELKKSMAVADVNNFVQPRYLPAGGDSWLNGATQRPYPPPLRVFPNFYDKIFGDSVFLLWEENMVEDRGANVEYEIKIRNDRDEELIKGTEKHNWIVLDIRPFFDNTEKRLFVNIRSNKTGSPTKLTLQKNDKVDQKLVNDLERLNNSNDLAMWYAVYDVNGYHYDRNFVLYKIISRGFQPTGLMIKYIELQTRTIFMK